MSLYISKHPFIFLISLVLIAGCCLGGALEVAHTGMIPVKVTVPVSVPATDTVSILLPTAITPPNSVITPNAFPTSTHENTPTLQPVTPLPTFEATVTLSTKSLVVHFINVGQGDSILLITPSGLTMLIDGGSNSTGVVAYLQKMGVRKIDLMVATHPHEDHIGGLTQVLEAMPVARVVTNGEAYTTSAYEHFLDAILNSGAEYSEAHRGDTISLGELTFSVLNPGGAQGDDPNENSLVLRLVYGHTTFLFMGDAGVVSETSMMGAGLILKSDILKVGHHGSCSSLSSSFLRAVQPAVGIYSAGVNNPYGFPCAATVSMLNQFGVQVLGTDVNGSITVTTTNDGYIITNAVGSILRR
jgi:competence protein ComEC